MCDEERIRWPDLTPQARAARAVYLLMIHREMRSSELAEALGYANTNGVAYLMDALTLGGVPVWRPQAGVWAILQGNDEGDG
ncbi:MAG: hypothetical protein KF770_13385 [Anaerolineae bacterium]|nr:hypothetical protein [Anaerolineae bacterium]